VCALVLVFLFVLYFCCLCLIKLKIQGDLFQTAKEWQQEHVGRKAKAFPHLPLVVFGGEFSSVFSDFWLKAHRFDSPSSCRSLRGFQGGIQELVWEWEG